MVDHIVDASRLPGRVEIRTGVGRRRRWSDERKGRIVAESYAPAGARVRRPVTWMAGWRGNQDSEAHRQGLPRGDHESPGRNESERESGLENE